MPLAFNPTTGKLDLVPKVTPPWAIGAGAAWDFKTGEKFVGATPQFDTHANPIVMRSAARAISKAANVVCRENGVGLQVVPSVAQLIEDPTNFTLYYPTVSGTGTTAQDAIDPAGAANLAWTLTDTSPSATYARQRNLTVANDSVTRVATVLVKKWSAYPSSLYYPSIQVGYAGGTAKNSRAALDPVTGEIVYDNTNASWWVEDWGDYWMVAAAIANNSTGNTTFFHVFNPARDITLSPSGNVLAMGATVFAWPNVYSTQAIPVPSILSNITAGANIALAAQAYAGQAFSGFVTLDIQDPGAGAIRLLTFDDGTANNYVAIEHSSGRTVISMVAGGVAQAAVDIGAWRRGRQTIAFAAGTNYVWGQFVRGLAVTPDTTATFPSVNKVGFGGLTGSTAERRARVVIEKLALKYGAADAAAAQDAYARAWLAHGAAPLAWDNFDRADGAIGSAASGHTWSKIPADGAVKVEAAISGKKLVATDSGQPTTASYSAVDIGQNISRVRARVSFSNATSGGAVALIVSPALSGVITYITDASIHVVFKDTSVDVGFFQAGVLTNIKTIKYPQPMLRDAATVYEIGYDLSGNTALIYIPNSPPIRVTDSRFASLIGRYFTVEHFWSTGQCQASIHEALAA
jgi:hypothetical protein